MPYGWPDCPSPVRAQVERLTDSFRSILRANLVGVYLHGSLAMGCFNPDRSDLDLLVITAGGMPVETKRDLMWLILHLSNSPRPVELSVLRMSDLHPWRHPAPFDLHYGEGAWRGRVESDLAGDGWRRWNDEARRDPDLAAHVTVTRARGISLLGRPIGEVFPQVPGADYYDSIYDDFRWIAAHPEENPVYGVLNGCRVLGYAETGAVLSKDEGGAWALNALPDEHRATVAEALAVYRGERAERGFERAALVRLLGHIDARLDPPSDAPQQDEGGAVP